jgi:V/A-type H+-transporting ATPase subunit D
MAILNVPPTKSSLLGLRRQLAFAEEGYELLEQKRQILVFELMSRLGRAREIERRVAGALASAHEALQEAVLDAGSAELDRVTVGLPDECQVDLTQQCLLGLRLPRLTCARPSPAAPFGPGAASPNAILARTRFLAVLPWILEWAELQTSVLRLARELRKTQRRCNALTRVFIPDYRDTIGYITGALEERERESFVIQKMIRARLRSSVALNP